MYYENQWRIFYINWHEIFTFCKRLGPTGSIDSPSLRRNWSSNGVPWVVMVDVCCCWGLETAASCCVRVELTVVLLCDERIERLCWASTCSDKR